MEYAQDPPMDMESDTDVDMEDEFDIDDIPTAREQAMESINLLHHKMFAAFIEHNMTQGAITAVQQAWLTTVGHHVPEYLRECVASTYKQLQGKFREHMPRIVRLPVCPGECSLLTHVKPSLTFSCHCDGTENKPWRYMSIFRPDTCTELTGAIDKRPKDLW